MKKKSHFVVSALMSLLALSSSAFAAEAVSYISKGSADLAEKVYFAGSQWTTLISDAKTGVHVTLSKVESESSKDSASVVITFRNPDPYAIGKDAVEDSFYLGEFEALPEVVSVILVQTDESEYQFEVVLKGKLRNPDGSFTKTENIQVSADIKGAIVQSPITFKLIQ